MRFLLELKNSTIESNYSIENIELHIINELVTWIRNNEYGSFEVIKSGSNVDIVVKKRKRFK